MDFVEILSRWKEFGALGVAIVLLAKLGDKLVVWLLEALGVTIKRGQSREDTLIADVATIRVEVDELKEDVVALKSSYKVVYDINHRAADGIQDEMRAQGWVSPVVAFFIGQMRTVQALEEILKESNGHAPN